MKSALDALVDFILFNIPAGDIIKIIDDATANARYTCKRCKGDVVRTDNQCATCHAPLRWIS